jgi:hypothetical protein
MSRSYQGAQTISHHSQELVTGGMAQRVVHVFEVIEVENVGSHDVAALGTCQGMLQPHALQGNSALVLGELRLAAHVHTTCDGCPAPLAGALVDALPLILGQRRQKGQEGAADRRRQI